MSELNTILFFKIWRNRLIKKNIYKYMLNQLKYESLFIDQICSVEWLCIMNHIQLLKKKVMNNEYLVFEIDRSKKAANGSGNGSYGGYIGNISNSGSNSGSNGINQDDQVEEQQQQIDLLWGSDEDDIPQDELINFKHIDDNNIDINNKYLVFKCIKDDQEFYKYLFKNYYKYFLTSNKKDTLRYIIKYDCIGALVVLKKRYSIIFKESQLIKSIQYESFQVAKYIYKKMIIKPSHKNIFIKTIHHNKVGPIRSSTVDKIVVFLVNILKIKVPSDLDGLQYSFNSNIMECTIRDIYSSCYSLALLKKPLATYVKSLKLYLKSQKSWSFDSMFPSEVTKLFLNFEYTWLSIDYLERVNIKQELFKIKLIDLDLNVARSLQDLEAMLRMVLPFIDVINTSRYMVGFMYYNYLYRDSKRIERILFYNYYENAWLFQKTRLFNSKSKIQYIKIITEYINRNSPHTPVYRKYQRRILNYFIQINDMESIKEVSEIMLSCNTNLSNRVFIELKDNTVLFDYFYTQCTPSHLFKFDYLLLNSNTTILNHYKSTYNVDFKKRAEMLNIKSIKRSPLKLYLLKFLYDNLIDFKVQFNYISNMWKPFDQNPNILDLTFQEFKFFITRMDNKYCIDYFGSHYNQFTNYEKFLYFKYQSYDLSNYIQLYSSPSSTNSNGSIGLPSSTFFIDNCKLVLYELGRRGDITTLNDIMINYFNNETSNINYKYHLYNLLYVACHYGQIEIFKYLFKHHSWLLLNYYDDDKFKNQTLNINNQLKLSDINLLLKYSKINYNLYDYLNKNFKIK